MAFSVLDSVTHGMEERWLEYKQSMSWDDAESRGNLIKRVISMANIQDGGSIVIGVRQQGERFLLEGVTPDHLRTYQQDRVSDNVNEYAAPYVELTVYTNVEREGKFFVVIQVRPFDQLPVVCKKDGPGGLRRGALYTRGRRRHETIEVSHEAEMREIIERAIDIGMARFIARQKAMGIAIPLKSEPAESGETPFEQQRGPQL